MVFGVSNRIQQHLAGSGVDLQFLPAFVKVGANKGKQLIKVIPFKSGREELLVNNRAARRLLVVWFGNAA